MIKKFLNTSVICLLAMMMAGASAALAQQLPVATAPEGESLSPQPRLVLLGPAVFDGGAVKAPASIVHTFEFKNEGLAPLKLSEVRSSCGCLVTNSDSVVEPGQTGSVTVTMNVYREWAGHELRRAAWVMSNDPILPQLRLIVSARALPEDTE